MISGYFTVYCMCSGLNTLPDDDVVLHHTLPIFTGLGCFNQLLVGTLLEK